jgi:hypothetical protein
MLATVVSSDWSEAVQDLCASSVPFHVLRQQVRWSGQPPGVRPFANTGFGNWGPERCEGMPKS